jgi:RNA polymerase-binding transcription factor DksA
MSSSATELFNEAELAAMRTELEAEAAELRRDIADSESDIAGLINDSGDGSGDDFADIGSKTFEREQDMFLVEQVKESLRQIERAIGRIDTGNYGICESCGQFIGRPRLEVYPRATMCMGCKIAEGG